MDEAVKKAAAYLPNNLENAVARLSDEQSRTVREIRLRAGTALAVSVDAGVRFLTKDGQLSAVKTPACIEVSAADVEDCVRRLCGFALHAHEEELRRGFVTADGCRAGIGGTVVFAAGQPLSMRNFTSVCLRIARLHVGIADPLLDAIGRVPTGGILVCGAPSSGKTSLLRDVAQGLSDGRLGSRANVAVVDERSELAFCGALRDCDVLTGCDKAEGIFRAVRCLSPEFLVFDEWTSERESQAVSYALSSGVRVVTSVHAPSVAAARSRAETAGILAANRFPVAAELARDHRCRIVTEDCG